MGLISSNTEKQIEILCFRCDSLAILWDGTRPSPWSTRTLCEDYQFHLFSHCTLSGFFGCGCCDGCTHCSRADHNLDAGYGWDACISGTTMRKMCYFSCASACWLFQECIGTLAWLMKCGGSCSTFSTAGAALRIGPATGIDLALIFIRRFLVSLCAFDCFAIECDDALFVWPTACCGLSLQPIRSSGCPARLLRTPRLNWPAMSAYSFS